MKHDADYSGFFPFGWVRGFRDDNWQIFWNKRTGDLFLKSTAGDDLLPVGNCADWMEAKKKADSVMKDPASVTAGFQDR